MFVQSLKELIFGKRVAGYPCAEPKKEILPLRNMECSEFNKIGANIRQQMVLVQSKLDEFHEMEKSKMDKMISLYNN